MKVHTNHAPQTRSFDYGMPSIYKSGSGDLRARLNLGVFDFDQIQRLTRACLSQQRQTFAQVDSWLRSGFDLEDIYLDGLVPSARLLGEWWCADQIGFAEVTLGLHRLQQVVYESSPRFLERASEKANGYSALFVVMPQSQHSLGSLMLAEFFRREGWQVTNGVVDSVAQVLEDVAREWFDIVGLSVNTDKDVQPIKALIQRARQVCANPGVQFMVGGPLVAHNPGLLLETGADLLGSDARESQRLAQQYVRSVRLV